MMNEYIEILAKRAKATAQQGDYIKGGILHCGVCNEPKQAVFTLSNGKKIAPSVLCKCGVEQRERERQAVIEAERQARKEQLQKGMIEAAKFTECIFDNDDGRQPEITEMCKKFVNAFPKVREKGYGLMFYGERGKGKSFYAACIANALIDKGYPVLFSTLANLVANSVKSLHGQDEQIRIKDYDLVVIDDLGVENASQTAFTIIDTVYANKIPLIVTTNLMPSDMKATESLEKGRIYDRLFEACTKKFLIKNNGSRTKKGNENLKDMLDFLD